MTHRLEKLSLTGPAGRLEALLAVPPRPLGGAVFCHPHPLFGGTMHTKAVYYAAGALVEAGFATLRFNFRGVGRSEGAYAEGEGEQDDLRAALAWLRKCTGDPRPIIGGFSFGARVALEVGCSENARALIALGLAPRIFDFSYLGRCSVPKLFVQGDQDEHGPLDEVQALIATAAPPARLEIVAGADHFFFGRLDQMREIIRAYVAGLPAN